MTASLGSPKPKVRRIRTLTCLAALVVGLSASWGAQAQSLIRDTEIEEILQRDADPLFDAAGLDSKGVKILLIGSKDLQASAAPGIMAVYTGLILQAENPNELQGVMAHEIGHLAGGHSFRSGDMMKAGLKPMLLTMGLGVLAALAGSTDGAAALMGRA